MSGLIQSQAIRWLEPHWHYMPSRPRYLQDTVTGVAPAHQDTLAGADEDGDGEEQWGYGVRGTVGMMESVCLGRT